VLPETVREGFENWNFNVSHHGEFVAIASEPTLLVRHNATLQAQEIETHLYNGGTMACEWTLGLSLSGCMMDQCAGGP
jgi:hypothetical protein